MNSTNGTVTFGMLARRATDAAPAEDVPPYEPGSASRLYTELMRAHARQDDAAAKACLEKLRLVALSMKGLTFPVGTVL